MRLLALSPMVDKLQLDIQQHYELLSYVLEVYGKSWHSIVCLVSDNVNTDKGQSSKCVIPLIGCCSHLFNLAVVYLITAESEILMKVNAIMVKVRLLLLSPRVQHLTELRPKVRNIASWNSTFKM